MKRFLHVGCGLQDKSVLKGFNSGDWEEVRFDIDENVRPDIVGTLADLRLVETSSVDAVYSSHNLEHVFPHEVPATLNAFHRVLKPHGIVVATCPDLQSVCKAVVEDRLLDVLYASPAGPISALDILYGHTTAIARGQIYMAHKCGFTYSVLSGSFLEAGFKNCFGGRRPEKFDLWLVAFKQALPEDETKKIAAMYLP